MKVINVPEGQYKVIRDGLVNVHPDYIQIQPGFNLRQMFTGIEELASSLITNGQDTPVVVRRDGDGTLWLVAGERRHRAAKLVNEKMLTNGEPPFRLACIIQDYDQTAADKANGRENLERENLTVYDLVKSTPMLKSQGLTYAQIGERLGGISEASAIDYSKLAKLPEKYLKMLIENPRLKSALIELMRLEGRELKEGLATWAAAEKPSWGLARDIVRGYHEAAQGAGNAGGEPTGVAAGEVDGDGTETAQVDASMAQAAETTRKKAKGNGKASPAGEEFDYSMSDGTQAGTGPEEDPESAAAVAAALGKKPKKPAVVVRYRNAKEITRFLESLEHPLAQMLVKHAKGAYTDKLMAKKWAAFFAPGEAAEG